MVVLTARPATWPPLSSARYRRHGVPNGRSGGHGDPIPALASTERHTSDSARVRCGTSHSRSERDQGAVLAIRDPRDVAVSFARFFAVSIDAAIALLGDERAGVAADARMWWTDEPWGSWSSHATSWLSEDVPFHVEVVRYEDLHESPTEALTRAFALAGSRVGADRIARAIELARFDELRREEDERGFEESSPVADRFFRSGRTGNGATYSHLIR